MIIVKVGGGETVNMPFVLEDFARISGPKILVHGGNFELNSLSKALQYPPKMITSSTGQKSRFTDEKTMDMFMMVYAGKINKRIVECLQKQGVNAFGVSGVDGGLVRGKRRGSIRCVEDGKPVVLHGDFTGSIEEVNVELLHLLLDAGYTPVITSPILSYEGDALNVDHDKLAMQIATSMKADKLIYLFEAPGLLQDVQDPTSVVKTISLKTIDQTLEYAQGRMKKKVLAAKWTIEEGVEEVYFSDGRVENPVQKALRGEGTVIRKV